MSLRYLRSLYRRSCAPCFYLGKFVVCLVSTISVVQTLKLVVGVANIAFVSLVMNRNFLCEEDVKNSQPAATAAATAMPLPTPPPPPPPPPPTTTMKRLKFLWTVPSTNVPGICPKQCHTRTFLKRLTGVARNTRVSPLMRFTTKGYKWLFSVECTQLYDPHCRSVSVSIGLSICHFQTGAKTEASHPNQSHN